MHANTHRAVNIKTYRFWLLVIHLLSLGYSMVAVRPGHRKMHVMVCNGCSVTLKMKRIMKVWTW